MTRPTSSINRASLQQRARNSGQRPDSVFRAVAINQLLTRLEATDPGRFMLKGGQALATRQATRRETYDIDLQGSHRDVREAIALVARAAALDIDDGLRFEPRGQPRELGMEATGGYSGLTLKFTVTLDARPFAELSLDVVSTREPCGSIETLPYPLPPAAEGLSPASVLVFPVEDHIADKVAATMQRYQSGSQASTRVRDLYDLCAIAAACNASAAPLAEALEQEWLRRRLEPTPTLRPPSAWAEKWPKLWRDYGSEPGVPQEFGEAVALAQALVSPILSGEVTSGAWNRHTLCWA